VQVAAADARPHDPHQRVGGLLQGGVRHVDHAYVARAVHEGCTHQEFRFSSSWWSLAGREVGGGSAEGVRVLAGEVGELVHASNRTDDPLAALELLQGELAAEAAADPVINHVCAAITLTTVDAPDAAETGSAVTSLVRFDFREGGNVRPSQACSRRLWCGRGQR
jgi:hypothetical protein